MLFILDFFGVLLPRRDFLESFVAVIHCDEIFFIKGQTIPKWWAYLKTEVSMIKKIS